MTIPAGWTPAGAGPWGMGNEPFEANVPTGPRYMDPFGNRCVMTPGENGSPMVEGVGTGVNAGKPDGEWWPWTEFLEGGPTDPTPWIGTEPGLTPGEGTDETPEAPTLAVEGAEAPVATVAPVTPEAGSHTATVDITPHPSGGVLVRIETATGDVITKVVKMAEHLVAEVEAFAHQHFGHHG